MSVRVARVLAGAVAVTATAVGAPAGAAPSGTPVVAPGGAGAVEGPATGAAVAGNGFSTSATCYGGAVRSYFERAGWGGDAGPYRTTSRCRDVNVRNASPFPVDACVIFVDRTSRCNYWTYLPARSGWIVVATNVKDGVNFRVRFETQRYEYEALTAHHAF
ncbi:hypothetical protein AWW66_31570 [Micromonospora rosaria]|uniref:Secreted protein n=1 Tax=Micromonospora rosaria TaxID=47874 RepID=A0A136PIB7_9ACTN|nr:hypothetical protein [Micromonospora rosaria]KXK58133.1 hypothetical protein AWW66_31570 [Micromonospora rosaria]